MRKARPKIMNEGSAFTPAAFLLELIFHGYYKARFARMVVKICE
jgi:hypothetical protein